MSKEKTSVVEDVLLSKIYPDANQPRKNFDAARLAELMSSIREHGIMNPLVIEKDPSGNYILVDGERRYRASKEIGLKKVPAIIVEPMSETDRLIKQFHLQEQHEGWSSVEKAVAIGHLSEQLGLTVSELSKILSLPERTVSDYNGFWNLLSRKEFQKSEVPLTYAPNIVKARNKAKKVYEATFEKEFILEKQKAIEQQIVAQIKQGEIKRPTDIVKLTDSFTQNPDTIDQFVKGRSSVTKLFIESNAKTAQHARLAVQCGNLTYNHILQLMKTNGVELLRENKEAAGTFKRLKREVDALLSQIT